MNSIDSKFVILVVILSSILISPCLCGIAFFAAGGGHGTNVPGSILFPYTFLWAYSDDIPMIANAAIVMGVVQYPIYGVVLAAAVWLRRPYLVLASLCVIHLSAVIAALLLRNLLLRAHDII